LQSLVNIILNQVQEAIESETAIGEAIESLEISKKVALVETDEEAPAKDSEVDNVFNELKEKYIQEFDLSDIQFDLVTQFYDQHKSKTTSNLRNKFINLLMIEALKERQVVKANEQDIKRALATLDSDNDEHINLDEFFQLLVLFFASKFNLKSRLVNILNNKSSDNENKVLNASEANQFVEFLNSFFASEFVLELNSEDQVSFNQLADQLNQHFASLAYVRWEDQEQQEAEQVKESEPNQEDEQEQNQ
jgi:hypothetical protein